MTKAFPCLFPYGVGDITNHGRQVDISETDAARHYVRYAIDLKQSRDSFIDCDDEYTDEELDSIYDPNSSQARFIYPFVEDDRFVCWIQNFVERHCANGQRNFWIGQNSDFSGLSGSDLFAIIRERSVKYHQLLGSMQSFNANI